MSLDQIFSGRLTLGVGVGSRHEDFEVAGQQFKKRRRQWDAALEFIHRAWKGKSVAGSPKPVTTTLVRRGGVPILIGSTYGESY